MEKGHHKGTIWYIAPVEFMLRLICALKELKRVISISASFTGGGLRDRARARGVSLLVRRLCCGLIQLKLPKAALKVFLDGDRQVCGSGRGDEPEGTEPRRIGPHQQLPCRLTCRPIIRSPI